MIVYKTWGKCPESLSFCERCSIQELSWERELSNGSLICESNEFIDSEEPECMPMDGMEGFLQ